MNEKELFGHSASAIVTNPNERATYLFAAQHANKRRPLERRAPWRRTVQWFPRSRAFSLQPRRRRVPPPRLTNPSHRSDLFLPNRRCGWQGCAEARDGFDEDEVPSVVDACAGVLKEGEEVGFGCGR